MTTSVPAFRQTQRVFDDAFDPDYSTSSQLYISFGAHRIRLGVLDAQHNKFVVLEDYEAERPSTVENAIAELAQLCVLNPLLHYSNWQQVRIGIKSQQFTLIPETLFDVNAREEYLKLNAIVEADQEIVKHYDHSRLELVNVFTIPASLEALCATQFKNSPITFVHQTSALMEGFLHMAERNTRPQLYIYVDKSYVTLVVLQGMKLEFCNSFFFTSPEDFMYYVLFVLQEKKMNPDQDPVTVWGELTIDSELNESLRKYIRHLQFGKKPTGTGFSYRFETLFNHRNFDMYSLRFCD